MAKVTLYNGGKIVKTFKNLLNKQINGDSGDNTTLYLKDKDEENINFAWRGDFLIEYDKE